MAAKTNSAVWLVPDESQDQPVLPPAPQFGSDLTYEERDVVRKYRANTAEEIAKGAETLLVSEIVHGINRDLMMRGLDTIEFGYALRREGARDPDEQKTVDAFLGMVVPGALQDQVMVAKIGKHGVQEPLRRPLTPDRKKFWQP